MSFDKICSFTFPGLSNCFKSFIECDNSSSILNIYKLRNYVIYQFFTKFDLNLTICAFSTESETNTKNNKRSILAIHLIPALSYRMCFNTPRL